MSTSLHESERLFRTIFEQAAVGVAHLDSVSGTILRVNARYCEILGTAADQLLDKTWMELTHPDDLESDLANMRRLRAGEIREFAMEKRLQRGDGRFVWINLTVSPMWQVDEPPSTHIAILQDISDRKRTEEKLAASEEKFEKAFRGSPDAITLTSLENGLMVDVNETACRITGYSREELIGRTTLEMGLWVHPADRQRYTEQLRRDGRVTDMKADVRIKSNEIRTGLFAGEIISLRDGDFILGIIRDITEQEQAAKSLRDSELRFRRLIEHAPEAVVLLDVESGRFTQVNPAAERLFKLPAEELCRRGPGELSPPFQPNGWLSTERVRYFIARVCEGETPAFEWMHRDARGRDVPCEVRLLQLRINGRTVVRGSITDITQRKQAEARLRESEARYRAVVEDQTELIVRWLPDGVRTFVNEAYCRCFGQTREELLGTSFYPLISPQDRERVRSRIAELTPHNPLSTADHRVQLPGGRLAWQRWSDRALYDRDGKLVGYQSVGRDITEQKEAELALRDSEEELRRLNAELELRVAQRTAELEDKNAELQAFAYSVSHDLRAPLRAMEGFANALAEDYGEQLDEDGRGYVQHIQDSSRRMDQLVDDLLAYSRLGQSELRMKEYPLNDIVRAAIGQLARDVAACRADLDVARRMPSVVGHEATLVQIVVNLISNGIKFVPEGTSPRIRIWAEPAERGPVRLWVQDNGIGIDSDHRERIFRIFERLHGVESYPGTGIGLAVVARACQRLGGRCGVESEPGQGSRFWVELPGKPAAS